MYQENRIPKSCEFCEFQVKSQFQGDFREIVKNQKST